jgi:hypothetical protein
MAPNDIDTKAHDATRRKRGAGVVAAIVFMVVFAAFVFRFEHWGLALGWFPAATVAAAFGRIAYCFPWVVDILAILLDLIVACIG